MQNLVIIISKFCVKELKIEKVDNQPLELEYLILSIEKALNEFGWIPRLDLEKTILNIVKWYKDVNKGKSPFQNIIGNIDSFL